MNVASANTVGFASTAFITARTSEVGGLGVETRTLPEQERSEEAGAAYSARYPVVALSYDQDASRLVMLFRDPASGEAVAQIPSKVVVKQYEEAQSERRRDERRKFELIVGGASEDQGSGSAAGKTGESGADGSVSIGAAMLAARGGGSDASGATGGGVAPEPMSPGGTGGGPVRGRAASLNLVI